MSASDEKAVRLDRALYSGRSSGALYGKDIPAWLQDYGFVSTSTDELCTSFRREIV
jgi:hypothetical protein